MSNPVVTTSLAVSDTVGEIFFNSDTVPYLQINASTGISGTSVNLSLSGSTGIGLSYDLATQHNIGITVGFQHLIPDFNNSIYYQSDGGITYATQVLFSGTSSPQVLVKQRDIAVYPYSIPELGTPEKVRFHNGKWYIMHQGNSDLVTSSNGLQWDSISMGTKFSNTKDIAFNNYGMGIVCGTVTTSLDKNTQIVSIDEVPLKLFLNEKIILPIPLAGFPDTTLYKIQSIIYSFKWIAVGTNSGDTKLLIIESDNGLNWKTVFDTTGTLITGSQLTPKSKIVFQPNTQTHIINLQNYYLTRSAQGVWSSTSVAYGLLDCDSNDTKTIFATSEGGALKRKTFNNVGLSLIDEEVITGGDNVSVQWDGTKWYIITSNTNTYTSVSGSGFSLSSSTPVAGFDTAAFSNQVERVADSYYSLNSVTGDTGPFNAAVINSTSQTFESVVSTLQYVVSGGTATPIRTSFATSDGYESFDLTFKSDILSTKTVEFIAGDEVFKFNIGPNGFKVPFEFETNTSQKTTPSYYSFIADGLKYARTRDKGTAYEKLKPLLDESYDIFAKLTNYSTQTINPLLPEWLNTLMGDYRTQFLNGEGEDYYFGKVNSIYGCNDVLKDNPYTGSSGATYGIESLAKIIADIDSSNFTKFKYEFEVACSLYGVTGNNILTSGENKIIEKFNSAIETAMSKSGYTFLKSGTAKKNLINQLLKFYTIEYYVSTDYTISENLNTDRNNYFEPAYATAGADDRRNTITQLLDYSKIDTYSDTTGATLITEPTYYTANSVFKVSYDTHILSFYIDSKLIHEFSVYSEEPMKIKLIANTINSGKLSNGTYGFRNISLGENSVSSILLKRKIKELTKTRLESSGRQSYLEKILKMNIIPAGSISGPNGNEDLFFETINTDINYYYTISQFTNHTELLKLCGTKILQGSTGSYNDHEYSDVDYSSAFNGTGVITQLKAIAGYMEADSTQYTDNVVFLQLQSDANAYFSSVSSDGIGEPYAYGIEDIYNISDTYVELQNLYAKKWFLTDLEKSYTTTLPPIIGKSLLLNEYSTDIQNKLNHSELKTKLHGTLTCNLSDMFGATLFNNTSVGSTLYNFLDEIKGLTGLSPLTYEKIFIEVQDAMGISLVAEKIITQEKLLNPYSKFINYLKTKTLFIPENNKQLDNEIINYFYGPVSSIPSNAYLPILGVSYSSYTSIPTGTDLCIYDKTFPSEFKYLYDINFSNNFPNVYDGMKLWFPLTNALTDISYSQSYIEAMRDFHAGTNILDITNLDVPQYKNILLAYNASLLPVASHEINEAGIFGEVVVPKIRETLQNTFKIDIGNKNKYFTDVETNLFKKHLALGSTGTLYPGLTSGSYGELHKFYDVNSLYLKLADDYNRYIEGIISTLISAVDTDPTFDSVGNLMRSVVNGATGLTGLNEYRRATKVLDDLAVSYKNMLGVSLGYAGNTGGLYAFDQYFTAYDNFDDSRLRWVQMMTDLYEKDGPNSDTTQSYVCQDFIMSIPPLDNTRWTTMIGGNTLQSYSVLKGATLSYGEKSYPRYNPYWKYFENDVVSYKGQLYKCYDTTRRYTTVNIPPGELYPNADGTYSQIESIPGIYEALPGNTKSVTNGRNVGVESLYAWEEWHYDPGLSGTVSLNDYLDNPPDAQDKNFQGYPQEIQYTLKGSSGGVEVDYVLYTQPYNSTGTYYVGELVKWNNTLYKCRGGAEVIKGVGVGQPPNFSNLSTSWTLVGLTGANTDNIPPGSNGVWKEIDNLSTRGNVFLENAFPEYVSTEVYNIGDYVTYLGKRYQKLANGTVILQNGTTGTISGIAPVTTTISDNSWIACPYIDLTQEGKNIPQYDNVYAYSNGDLVVYKNIVYKNMLNQGSTGLYVEGSQYSKGQVVIAYEGYKFLSLKDNNIDNPPYPRNGSSKFWNKAYDSAIQPSSIPGYNFQNDYNSIYHLSGGQTLSVWYDGAVYTWKDPLNINYQALEPNLSNLYEYGVVKGVEPPLPEPFIHWVLAANNERSGNLNLLKNTTIYQYNPNRSYVVDDIVYYEPFWKSGSYYFKCTGGGYGTCINEAGESDITELFISSKEIDFGRALFDETSKTTYNETYITTEGVNERDASIPKWGEGMIEDPWVSYGFCRNLRYKLASGLEITSSILKQDRDALNLIKNSRNNISGVLLTYLNSRSTQVFNDNPTSTLALYTDDYVNTNYNTAEFYYYSGFLMKLNDYKRTIQELTEQNNQIYDYWLDMHGKLYQEALREYLMTDALKITITGEPLYAGEFKLDPFPTDGYAKGTKDEIIDQIEALKIGYLFGGAKDVSPRALVHGKIQHPGGYTGVSGTSFISSLGSLQPFTYYDPDTTYDQYRNYYFEKTIDDAKNNTVSISTLIPGYTNAVKVINYNKESIAYILAMINFFVGKEKLDLMYGRTNIQNLYPSWMRNNLAIYTGTDYPILAPIITAKDREYLQYDIENVWSGTSTATVGAIAPVKKNMWYTGSKTSIQADPAFDYNNIWMEQSFNPNVPGLNSRGGTTGGITGPEYTRYLTEPLFFDLRPNYYRFQEVEDTWNELFYQIEKVLPNEQISQDFPGVASDRAGVRVITGWNDLKYIMENGKLIRITANLAGRADTLQPPGLIKYNSAVTSYNAYFSFYTGNTGPHAADNTYKDISPTYTRPGTQAYELKKTDCTYLIIKIVISGFVAEKLQSDDAHGSITKEWGFWITTLGLIPDTEPQPVVTTKPPPAITTANDYSYWNNQVQGATGITYGAGQITFQPFGAINRNVPQWAKDKNFLEELQGKIAAATIFGGPLAGILVEREERPKALRAKADEFWNHTRYDIQNPINITETDLYYYQGKKPFKKQQNYMSILAYIRHIKKCSYLPAISSLPPRVAQTIRDAGWKQEYEEIYKAYSDATRIALIVVVTLILAASAVVTGGASLAAAGGLSALFTAASFATLCITGAAVGTMVGISKGLDKLGVFNPIAYLGQLLSDPGKIFFPPHSTDEGLMTRCAMLQQISEQTSPDISVGLEAVGGNTTLKFFATPKLHPPSYQEYNYAKLALKTLIETVSSEIKNALVTKFDLEIGKIQLLATQYINKADIPELDLFLPDITEEYLKYYQLYERTIINYETQLFFPVLARRTPVDRPATLRITYLQWEPDSVSQDKVQQLILGSTGDRPSGFSGVCYVKINIEDPGEGFYDYDESGNQVEYRYVNPAPATTSFSITGISGATFSIEDLQLIGRYRYDSPDPLKTAVYGLATFNHFDRETIGFNGKIAITWSGGNELVNKTFQVLPPVKSGVGPPFPTNSGSQLVKASSTTGSVSKWKTPQVTTNRFSTQTGKLTTVGGTVKQTSVSVPKVTVDPPKIPTPPPPPPPPPPPFDPPPPPPPPPIDPPKPPPPVPDPIPTPTPKVKIIRFKFFNRLQVSYLNFIKTPGFKAASGTIGIIGAAVDVAFAIINIVEISKLPPVNTDCTSISNRGNQ